MAQLAKIERTVQDASGTALSGVSVTIYREGATVNGAQSGTDPLTVTVHHPGRIIAADTVFVNTTTGTTYSVDLITDTTVKLSGFAGTLVLSDGDRLVASNNQPTIYSDDQGGASTTNPLTTSAVGYVSAFVLPGIYDILVSGGSATTTLYPSNSFTSDYATQVRDASNYALGSSTGGIQEAINDLPSTGGEVYVPPGTITTTAVIQMNTASVTLRGAGPSSIIKKGYSGNLIQVPTSNCVIRDLYLDGNRANFASGVCVTTASSATDTLIENCIITGAQTDGVHISQDAHRTIVRGCKIDDCLDIGIECLESQECRIENNWIDSSANNARCIDVRVDTAGKSCRGTVVADNICIYGDGTGGMGIACRNQGDNIINVSVTGNTIRAAGVSADYALTIRGTHNSCFAGNTIDIGQVANTGGAIEIIACASTVVTGHSIYAQGIAGTDPVVDINNSDSCVFSGNTIDGFGASTADFAILVNSTDSAETCDFNVIADNTIIFPTSGQGVGIKLLTQNALAETAQTCSNNVVKGNTILGVSHANSIGIDVVDTATTAGTLDSNTIMGNIIDKVGKGIQFNDTQVTNLHLIHNHMGANVTTAYSGTAGAGLAFDDLDNRRAGMTWKTFTDADTTPSVAGGNLFKTANTSGATSITNFDDGIVGQMIVVWHNDANTTIVDGGNLLLTSGSGNQTGGLNKIMMLFYDGTNWAEIARSAN